MMHHQRAGVDGIMDTLSHMQRLTNRAITNELIRAQAVRAIEHCHKNDKPCQAASLLAWVKRSMLFVRDPHGVEALHDPIAVARVIQAGRKPYGDCDDMAMYLAALLKSVGIPVAFRVAGFMGKPYSHVYVEGPGGMKLDPTRDDWNPSLGELLRETASHIYPV